MPVIFGFVMNSTTKFDALNKVGQFKMILRVSLLDLSRKVTGQLNIDHLTVSQGFYLVDLVLTVEKLSSKMSLLFASSPSGESEKLTRLQNLMNLNFQSQEFCSFSEEIALQFQQKEDVKFKRLKKGQENIFHDYMQYFIKFLCFNSFDANTVVILENDWDYLMQTFFPSFISIFLVATKSRMSKQDDSEYQEV